MAGAHGVRGSGKPSAAGMKKPTPDERRQDSPAAPVIDAPGTTLPCRRCHRVTDDPVVIYGADPTGALVPKAAQCRGLCAPPGKPRTTQPDRRSVGIARKPGRCSGCPRDIVPGDRIMRTGEMDYVHLECAPASMAGGAVSAYAPPRPVQWPRRSCQRAQCPSQAAVLPPRRFRKHDRSLPIAECPYVRGCGLELLPAGGDGGVRRVHIVAATFSSRCPSLTLRPGSRAQPSTRRSARPRSRPARAVCTTAADLPGRPRSSRTRARPRSSAGTLHPGMHPLRAHKSVPSAVAADWTLPMSVMTTSSWLRPPLSRHEMTWLVQSGGGEAAAEETAGAVADVLDVAATFPAGGELCGVTAVHQARRSAGRAGQDRTWQRRGVRQEKGACACSRVCGSWPKAGQPPCPGSPGASGARDSIPACPGDGSVVAAQSAGRSASLLWAGCTEVLPEVHLRHTAGIWRLVKGAAPAILLTHPHGLPGISGPRNSGTGGCQEKARKPDLY
jgi:hypothetical protein